MCLKEERDGMTRFRHLRRAIFMAPSISTVVKHETPSCATPDLACGFVAKCSGVAQMAGADISLYGDGSLVELFISLQISTRTGYIRWSWRLKAVWLLRNRTSRKVTSSEWAESDRVRRFNQWTSAQKWRSKLLYWRRGWSKPDDRTVS